MLFRSFGGMLRKLENGAGEARMWFVRIPRSDVPTEGIIEWLDQRWLELDRAVAERIGESENQRREETR